MHLKHELAFDDIVFGAYPFGILHHRAPRLIVGIYEIGNILAGLFEADGYEGGVYDKRPCNGDGFVYDKTYAFYLDTASDIRITGCNIYWAFPQLTQAGGDIKEKNTIRVKINKK